MKIEPKITAIAVLPIVLTAAFVLAITLYQLPALRSFVAGEVDLQAQSEAKKIAQNVYLMCRAAQESAQNTVDANLRVAADILGRSGPVTLDRRQITWQAVDQFSRLDRSVTLPRFLVGGQWLGQNRELTCPTPVVDHVQKLVGGTATIFQRMNRDGDMLRVATNVVDGVGQRAIGTYIPAHEPDGRLNQVVQTLLRGETFRGRAYVVNAWYITAYQPIWNTAGKEVIGALYVGVREENLTSLRQGIMDIVVGKTGYVWVLGGHGEQRGRYLMSKDGRRDGEMLYDLRDEKGELFVRRIINKALTLPAPLDETDIPVVLDRYPWINPGETEARYKSVAITYFAPWDWVIGAAYYESDFTPLQQRMARAVDHMLVWIAGAAFLVILIAYPVGRLVASGIRSHVDSILKSVNDILIVTDSQDRIYLLSQEAQKLFGVRLAQVRKHPLSDLIHDQEICGKIIMALGQRRSGVQVEFDWPGTGKTPRRTMQGRTSVIQSRTGAPLGMILAVHEVTAERQAERVKSELLSTAAHELNTPLTSIIGFSELMLQNPGQTIAEHKESLTYINRKAWALSRLVSDLLDVSRIEAGKAIPVSREVQDVLAVIRQVLQDLENLSSRHHFVLTLPEGPILVPLDRARLEQVLENILSNSIKYSPGGGDINIAGTTAPEGFHLSVSDQGIGMTSEEVARVFDKFYRADSSNTAINGTGLGMTIVREIIDGHGGRVWVESNPGRGTSVHLVLPWGDGETLAVDDGDGRPPGSTSMG